MVKAKLIAMLMNFAKQPSCLNCQDLNPKCVCTNPECSPVALTKWKRKGDGNG